MPTRAASWPCHNDQPGIQTTWPQFECLILADCIIDGGLKSLVSNARNIKTCGRDPSSGLVLEHSTVSRLHARIELADDGLVFVEDADSSNGTFLNRNDTWIRVSKVTLCIGDRIRFGECEVTLDRITAVFGNRSGARLEARHFLLRNSLIGADLRADLQGSGASLQKPRRNPVTGKIEDEHHS